MDILILAAGKGTRMKNSRPKVLFDIAGRPMLYWIIKCIRETGEHNINLMLGHEYERVRGEIENYFSDLTFFIQKEQLGTGHALMEYMRQKKDHGDELMVLCGDTPLLLSEEISRFQRFHEERKNVISVMSTILDQPKGYGRVIKDGIRIRCIVEEKDCSENQRKIKEVNSGIYIFRNSFVKENINKLNTDNAQGEFYITDLVRMAHDTGSNISSYVTSSDHIMGVNNIYDLSTARKEIGSRICARHMENGVDIYDPGNVYIDESVIIEPDTVIRPYVSITGDTVIRKGSHIGSFSSIHDSVVNGTRVDNSHLNGAQTGNNSDIGPYSRLREGTVVGERCRVGNFVETKKSVLEDGVKASHLSYIGDSNIGQRTNIGAGTITCNYDGKNKHRTVIGEDCFIGSNSTLIAPVSIGKGSFTAGGSVINRDVPENTLAFGRARQKNKENYRSKK